MKELIKSHKILSVFIIIILLIFSVFLLWRYGYIKNYFVEIILGYDPKIGGVAASCSTTGPINVYKLKKDYYLDNVFISVGLDKNNKEIVLSYPQNKPTKHLPEKLVDGYFLGGGWYGNTVLSIPRIDYETKPQYSVEFIGIKNLLNYIEDRDPYLESYECCGKIPKLKSSINYLIQNKKLSEICIDLKKNPKGGFIEQILGY